MSFDSAALLASGIFFIKHWVALLVAAIVAWAIGRRIIGNRLSFANSLESICFSLALGLGTLSFLVLLIGQLHLLYPTVLVGSLLLCLLASYPVLLSCFRQLKEVRLANSDRKDCRDSKDGKDEKSHWSRTLLLLIGAGVIFGICIPFLTYPLYPAKDWDATQYHLAAPKIYIKEHAVVFTPYLRYPVFPQTNQMLFTGALLLYDEQFAQQMQFLMLITLCGAMIAFAMRHLTSRAGWWGVALLLANPLIFLLGSIAYADIGLTLFCFLSCYAFWNWSVTRQDSWIVVTGICSGLAFGSKYTGAFFPLAFFARLVWTEWRERNYRTPLLLTAITFLVSAPWLVRNIYFTGNPIFPFLETFFTGIFGQRQIDPVWFQEQVGASLYIGTGRSLTSLLTLPWKFVVDNAAFIPEAPISTLVVWLLPLTVACAFFRPQVRSLLALCIAYTIFWFFGYQLVRYLVPAFPLYCLATGAGIAWVLPQGFLSSARARRLLTATVFAVVLFPSWYYIAQHVKWEGMLPTTPAQRDRYLTERMSSYPAYQFLNNHVGNDYRLYALDDVKMAYFADGTFLGDWYGEANYPRIRAKMTSGEALYDELKQLRASHLLFNAVAEQSSLPKDDFFKRNFRLTFVGNKTEVFELSPEKIR